jgi:hypothetical protein
MLLHRSPLTLSPTFESCMPHKSAITPLRAWSDEEMMFSGNAWCKLDARFEGYKGESPIGTYFGVTELQLPRREGAWHIAQWK